MDMVSVRLMECYGQFRVRVSLELGSGMGLQFDPKNVLTLTPKANVP